MKRSFFFVLAMIVIWIGMLIRTFFWWNSDPDNKNIPQHTNTWFIQEITDTWNSLKSWDIQTNIPKTTKNGHTEIKVMMPKYFYNAWRKIFAEDLYNEKNIYMKFILVDDLYWYKNQLFDTNFSEADLFLFPYDWNEKISTRTFSPQQNIQTYFDSLLSPILQETQVSFLPFAADPMIMYATTWYSLPNSFYDISEFVLNREPTRSLSFPLFFGIDTEDANDKWFKREYQDIVRYALLHYFKTNNDSHDLQTRIDSNVLEKYSIQNLNTISNIITTPECQYFPSICFQVYNFVWIRFWFLSDTDIVNQYLPNKKSDFSSLQKLTVPFFQLESPVRIRWRWINHSLEDPEIINSIYSLYKQYMNNYYQYNLRNSTLPVFKPEIWNWLLDNKYIWLRWYILQSWWDYINTLKWINKFRDLIEYKITAKEYLR